MSKLRFAFLSFVLLTSLAMVPKAEAAVLFQNPFPAGPSTGWTSNSPGWRVFDNFTLANDSVLTGFEFGSYFGNSSSLFSVSIFTDSTFSTQLFTQNFTSSQVTVTPTSGGSANLFVSLPNLALTAGTYWISPYSLSGSLNINVSSVDVDGSLIQGTNASGSPNFARGDDMAMRIFGNVATTDVPAPGALALLGVGLIGIAGMRRKKRAA